MWISTDSVPVLLRQMEKTEKTMAELEIDQNIKFEWDSITESGSALTPLSGPGCDCFRLLSALVLLLMPPHSASLRASCSGWPGELLSWQKPCLDLSPPSDRKARAG